MNIRLYILIIFNILRWNYFTLFLYWTEPKMNGIKD